jgi:aminoglycoside phosphotransferase (APT) family kinase protein
MDALTTALKTRLEALTGGPVEVEGIVPLVGGACQDNYKVDLRFERGELAGARRRFVLRSDAKGSLPGSLGRKEEFAVIRTATERAVRTPRVRFLFEDLLRAGANAYLMEWAEGDAIGAKILRDPQLQAAREKLPSELAAVLTQIHGITAENAPELQKVLGEVTRDTDVAKTAVADQRAALARIPELHPGLELALLWLESHPPESREVTLVHGDFRTGNFMLTPNGLSAVLDWEFARWGHPFEDIAWLCVRDWRFGQVKNAAGGFARRDTLYEAYERASGRRVIRSDVHYWEVMGNVRWAIGALVQGLRYTQGGETDIELVAIPRRAVEMEFEALRLIELAEGR